MKLTAAQLLFLVLGAIAGLLSIIWSTGSEMTAVATSVAAPKTVDWDNVPLNIGGPAANAVRDLPPPVYTPLALLSEEAMAPILEALKININEATAEELDKLPGIGPTTAQRIVDDRDARGPYASIWDLTRVPRLSQKTVEKLSDRITTGQPSPPGTSASAGGPAKQAEKKPAKPRAPSSKKKGPAGLINLNTASLSDLQQLPRVGEKTAQRIVDHREQNGPFQTTEDLMQVKGIGPKTYDNLKDMITVE